MVTAALVRGSSPRPGVRPPGSPSRPGLPSDARHSVGTPGKGRGRVGREPKGGPRQSLRLVEHLLERASEPVDIGLVYDERRQALEHVERMAGHLAQDVVLAKERAYHELREDPRLSRFEEPPGA